MDGQATRRKKISVTNALKAITEVLQEKWKNNLKNNRKTKEYWNDRPIPFTEIEKKQTNILFNLNM